MQRYFNPRRLAAFGVAVLAAATSVVLLARPADAAVGLHISGTNIVEANGQTFVMRGVNHPHVWFTGQTSSFANIKALGANTVRVVLGSGKRWGPSTDVGNVIALCKQNKLICVLEVHDTTGYGEEGAAAALDEAANYWISQKSALVGQENYVVINIGNEPIGNTNAAQWTAATTAAIQKLRANGFEHLLMVDGPNWGQDWQYVMRDNAQTILNADSQRNTVLSIHMYAVFNTAAAITDYLNRFRTNGWPLVVGEFGWRFNANEVDHETILSEANARGLVVERQHRSDPRHGDELRPQPAHHVGPAHLQRCQRHQANGQGSIHLQWSDTDDAGHDTTHHAPDDRAYNAAS
jgi:mannan endo-1,4-beta-mannosidase